MRILLNEPLNIDVSEIAKHLPQFVHRKPFMGTFGFESSELIRNDYSKDIRIILLFDKKVSSGFYEITSDLKNLNQLSYWIDKLPLLIRNRLYSAFENATILLSPYSSESEQKHWRTFFLRTNTALALEEKIQPTLRAYQGKMTSTANTDIEKKVINLDVSQDPLKTSLSYVYELKNVENSQRYLMLCEQAKRKELTKSEFVRKVLNIEAEAVYFRSQAFCEMKLPEHLFPCNPDYLKLYHQTRQLVQSEAVLCFSSYICEFGFVKRGHAAKKYYSDYYDSLAGRNSQKLKFYAQLSGQSVIIVSDVDLEPKAKLSL